MVKKREPIDDMIDAHDARCELLAQLQNARIYVSPALDYARASGSPSNGIVERLLAIEAALAKVGV